MLEVSGMARVTNEGILNRETYLGYIQRNDKYHLTQLTIKRKIKGECGIRRTY